MLTKQQVYEWCADGKEVVSFVDPETSMIVVCLSLDTTNHCFDENDTVELYPEEFESLYQ